MSKRCFRWRFM